ncbi:glycosyltransferase family 2 protein [Microbacterium sp. P5_E9]
MSSGSPISRRTVSVVVPLYNGVAHIAETLTSIQNQSFPVTQVIVIDDGSTDDGADIARSHPIQATVVTQPNRGVAVARNHGLSLVTCEWVAFLDQDDLWHPEHLHRTMAWLDQNPGIPIVFVREVAFSTLEDGDGLRAMDELAGGWASIRVPSAGALAALVDGVDATGSGEVQFNDVRTMLRGPISVTTSFVSDPALLRLAGGFAPHAPAMDDYWLLVNVARLAPIPSVNQPTVFYRVHTSATSRSTRLGMPFLSSAVALRLGGGVIPVAEGLGGHLDGKLHDHLFGELLSAPEYRDRSFRNAVGALARLLYPPSGRRRERVRAHVAARLPWLRTVLHRLPRGRG